MRNHRRATAVLLAIPVLGLVATLSIPLLAVGIGDTESPAVVECGPDAPSPSILGPSSMPVADLTAWWASTGRGQPPALAADIDDVIALYVTVGDAEGVRGDMALAQAILETGHFTSTDTARNNFAGIGHAGGAPTGLPFPDAATGVRAHIQLLKKYAAGNDTPLAAPDVAPDAGASATTWDELATR